MFKAKISLYFLLPLLSFMVVGDRSRLIFEEEKGMRSSFCMYSDGRFFEARPIGCTEQMFYSGTWVNENDTVTFNYKNDNVYKFEILKSLDTSNKYQIVKVLDCYNQPVRFQIVCADTNCQNLYNPAILKTEKGKLISYFTPFENSDSSVTEAIESRSDTIIFKWACNRESIESINGGILYINKEFVTKRGILKNRRLIVTEQ